MALSATGIRRGSPGLAATGVLLGTPFLLYLWGTPDFRLVAPVVLVFYYASAVAVAVKRRVLAAILAAPFLLVALWIGLLVPSRG